MSVLGDERGDDGDPIPPIRGDALQVGLNPCSYGGVCSGDAENPRNYRM
jgi:hypothetical protein